jgi:D-glycero-alpha-D-manno-heptose 1-phosphate guanylyltransferase
MIKESIILAGGLGTRLRNVIPDLPKCMAPVSGRPFLFYVINYLRSQGIEKFIFSLGYMQRSTMNVPLRTNHSALEAQFSLLYVKQRGKTWSLQMAIPCTKLTYI